jgi:hypothetical protein
VWVLAVRKSFSAATIECPGEDDKAPELTNIYGAPAANARYYLHTAC